MGRYHRGCIMRSSRSTEYLTADKREFLTKIRRYKKPARTRTGLRSRPVSGWRRKGIPSYSLKYLAQRTEFPCARMPFSLLFPWSASRNRLIKVLRVCANFNKKDASLVKKIEVRWLDGLQIEDILLENEGNVSSFFSTENESIARQNVFIRIFIRIITYSFYVILESTYIRAADYTCHFWIGELSAISSMEIEPADDLYIFGNDTRAAILSMTKHVFSRIATLSKSDSGSVEMRKVGDIRIFYRGVKYVRSLHFK